MRFLLPVLTLALLALTPSPAEATGPARVAFLPNGQAVLVDDFGPSFAPVPSAIVQFNAGGFGYLPPAQTNFFRAPRAIAPPAAINVNVFNERRFFRPRLFR